jgi:glutamate-1-semialdehyde aminotransferase
MQPYEASKELPRDGFLEGVKRITHENNAVLIFDEIRTGFRMALGGAQEYFGVVPDMAAVSKAIANGYPISAVVGRREVMQVAEKTRLSSTFLVNTFPMIAAIETIRELQEKSGVDYMWTQGKRFMESLKSILDEQGVEAQVVGVPPLPVINFTDRDEKKREALKKRFFLETTARGVLFHPNHGWFLSLAHRDKDITKTLDVSRESLRIAKRSVSG